MLNPLPGLPPELLRQVRQRLSRLEGELLDRVVAAGSTMAANAANRAAANLEALMRDMMTMLGKLPHALANRIVDLDRGPNARRLTDAETRLVREAFGDRVPPARVRIVSGAGYSLFAMAAFRNGNPAITIGNTFYIKPGEHEPHNDLSRSPDNINLLLHEYTHVTQYARLGFARFGTRYIAEMRRHGGAHQLYDYASRNLDWAHETIEGQAAIVGDYAEALHGPANPKNRQTLAELGAKLRGTGIYGK